MVKKILKKLIFGTCLLSGIVILIGTAGSSDIGTIDFKSIISQSKTGLLLVGIGYLGL